MSSEPNTIQLILFSEIYCSTFFQTEEKLFVLIFIQIKYFYKDLVVLLSWSSTTADMVFLARKLLSLKVVMVGITEKVFADMALIAAKSGGVIPILSGEEVTVAGVKSTVCMLFCLDLFLLWVGSSIGRADRVLGTLEQSRGTR